MLKLKSLHGPWVTSKPPESKLTKGKGKTKGTKTSASTARGKNSAFGLPVNKVQVEHCGAVTQQEQKRQPTPRPSTSCTSSGGVDGSTANYSENEFVGKHPRFASKRS